VPTLDLREQWIAAQWAVKTCFVFQSLGQEMLAPKMQPVLLKMNGRPPPQVTVFIGSHHRALRDPANSVYLQKPLTLEIEDRSFSTSDTSPSWQSAACLHSRRAPRGELFRSGDRRAHRKDG
jgi:hypothetical protein